MNRINTGFVTDPSVQQPFTIRSLDFIQDSNKEVINALCQSIIQQAGEDNSLSVPYIIREKTLSGSTDYYIYYEDEIYYMGVSGTGHTIAVLTTTNHPTADPLTFTDGFARNVHNIRTLVPSTGTTGTGLFDLADMVDVATPISLEGWHSVGAVGEPAFQNSWVNNYGSGRQTMFRKDNNGMVHLRGAIAGSNTNTIFTLPAGYRPTSGNDEFFAVAAANGTNTTYVIAVETNGNVSLGGSPGGTIGLYLNGVSFWTQ